jgi:hypothetical protein
VEHDASSKKISAGLAPVFDYGRGLGVTH